MVKRIFIIGQCTLHWGRMEFGNIGNYYVAKPLFQELRRVFPDTTLVTTMQFSQQFCSLFCLETIPMSAYYDFDSDNNLEEAISEYVSVQNRTPKDSAFIHECMNSDLVIDFSGDIWGKNADFLGKDRFLVGCYKDLTAQLLSKTIMIAGSPGPFSEESLDIAMETYAGFKFVTNREPVSTRILKQAGFSTSNTSVYPCPSFLFNEASECETRKELGEIKKLSADRIAVGIIICGWNFARGPFDAWPREEYEYSSFIELIKYLIMYLRADVYLLSHSNGFDIPPKPFALKHGRDFPIVKQLKVILDREGLSQHVTLLEGIYNPETTKAIISKFDFLISGRLHGAVAGLSQYIPTLILNYGHEPKAIKLLGFSEIVDEDILADPNNIDDMISKAAKIINNLSHYREDLENKIPAIKRKSKEQFDRIKEIAECK